MKTLNFFDRLLMEENNGENQGSGAATEGQAGASPASDEEQAQEGETRGENDKTIYADDPILSDELLEKGSDKLEKIIKLPKKFEFIDGIIINQTFKYLNKHYSKYVPPKAKLAIRNAFEGFVEDDKEKMFKTLPLAISAFGQIKQVSPDTQTAFFAIMAKVVFEVIEFYANQPKKSK